MMQVSLVVRYRHFIGTCCCISEVYILDMTIAFWVQDSRNIQHLHSCYICIHCHQLTIQVTIMWLHRRRRLLLGTSQTSPTTAQTPISISSQCWEQTRLDMVLIQTWPQPRVCENLSFVPLYCILMFYFWVVVVKFQLYFYSIAINTAVSLFFKITFFSSTKGVHFC